MVTGDSQEEVLIFRDKQAHLHHNIYIVNNVVIIKESIQCYRAVNIYMRELLESIS